MPFSSHSGLFSASSQQRLRGSVTAVAFPDIRTRFGQELQVLRGIGLERPLLARLLRQAIENGSTMEQELLVSGSMEAQDYYCALAGYLGLPFLATLPIDQVLYSDHMDSQLIRPSLLRLHDKVRPPITVIVPEARHIDALHKRVTEAPDLRASLAVTTPRALAGAVWQAGSLQRVEKTTNHLFETAPLSSARMVLTGRQGFWLGSLLTAAITGLAIFGSGALAVVHILTSLLYLWMLAFRAVTLAYRVTGLAQQVFLPATAQLPVYTVLVALYRESAMVPQLIESLQRLDWPAARLDIKLVCEADDLETLGALASMTLPAHIEVIATPPVGPRTKPKALTYALSGARGDFLVLYDAEDRPHPAQLKQAYAHFLASAPEVACLQAPLIIANGDESWISGLFALEYAALFRGILPMLALHRLPLPLGGTSNHFRTEALKDVGAWDPYNVTEDADLGLRLFRAGYRCETITLHTLEDAPVNGRIWLGQRSRWFKGWLQTWLIVMRTPRRAVAEMGPIAFAVFHLMIGGMLLSSLSHPALLLFLGVTLANMIEPPIGGIPIRDLAMFWIDFVNILGSYLIFLALGRAAMTEFERRRIGRRYLFIPIYWLMTSVAAWNAMIELKTKPFFWNKTPHMPRSRAKRSDTPPPERS
ncbi:glycosyltransferase family 2 protein [Allorhizobium taibaishanense]|uniref:Cellulose synthase/poly-beta-1,6-N-acetylglucosamine synthase-like glycosyltransferase n=1 Tax=Allorhizobium taibaishanense TaxID=887144 RepID=A0A7W6HQ54_9HYPH|nr:glycosyltransferase family 2 protein [Allorhizobium taibaishanense]MBB4009389.1 cellulose synthase/poly-beta-1,6-N-acetylglucosamine synthase-like glycosyltransferase [Allorhizobium taibaishanense]